MSERFKVTKSEEPNTFPNYGATAGMDADDSHGKATAETEAKQPRSSLEETIGRREQKKIYISSLLLKLELFCSIYSVCF
jgi:hypothetical protein